MEKPSKEIEKITSRILKEAGLEKPSISFKDSVMSAIIVEEKKKLSPIKPLITKRGWLIIGTIFTLVIGLLYLLPLAVDFSYFSRVVVPVRKEINPFAGIEISPTLLYGIGFMSLFLVQIPLLKKYLGKQL